jgi:hypothetical protein
MKIIPINTTCTITDKKTLEKIDKQEKIYNLEISAYVEESFTRHITLNISPDIETEGFDIFLDVDIYQAELLGKRILQLVENRKQYLETKLNEDEQI